MGRWSECSVVIVFQVVRLLKVELAVVTSGEVACCCALYGSLVGVCVFSVVWFELIKMSDIRVPLWSSMGEYHREACAFMSPVIMVWGMLVRCVRVSVIILSSS